MVFRNRNLVGRNLNVLSGHRAERSLDLLLKKGGEFMRLFVDKKEIPILINALVDYLGKHPSERYAVERLLNKIDDCNKLQVTQNRKVK